MQLSGEHAHKKKVDGKSDVVDLVIQVTDIAYE